MKVADIIDLYNDSKDIEIYCSDGLIIVDDNNYNWLINQEVMSLDVNNNILEITIKE